MTAPEPEPANLAPDATPDATPEPPRPRVAPTEPPSPPSPPPPATPPPQQPRKRRWLLWFSLIGCLCLMFCTGLACFGFVAARVWVKQLKHTHAPFEGMRPLGVTRADLVQVEPKLANGPYFSEYTGAGSSFTWSEQVIDTVPQTVEMHGMGEQIAAIVVTARYKTGGDPAAAAAAALGVSQLAWELIDAAAQHHVGPTGASGQAGFAAWVGQHQMTGGFNRYGDVFVRLTNLRTQNGEETLEFQFYAAAH